MKKSGNLINNASELVNRTCNDGRHIYDDAFLSKNPIFQHKIVPKSDSKEVFGMLGMGVYNGRLAEGNLYPLNLDYQLPEIQDCDGIYKPLTSPTSVMLIQLQQYFESQNDLEIYVPYINTLTGI